MAEEVIETKASALPIAVVRPSIGTHEILKIRTSVFHFPQSSVIGTVKEPLAGWIDNFYGSTGILIGAALGVMRTMHGDERNRADVVPADYVTNSAIAAAWNISKER